MGNPYQILLAYGMLVYIVYLATDGFRNNAPFVFTLPVLVLGFLSLGTHMPRRKKLLTSISFVILGQSFYYHLLADS